MMDLYDIGDEISQGTYIHCKAYACVEKSTGDPCTYLRFSDNMLSVQGETKSLLRECAVLQQLSHANIIEAFGFFERQQESHKHYVMILEGDSGDGHMVPLLQRLE